MADIRRGGGFKGQGHIYALLKSYAEVLDRSGEDEDERTVLWAVVAMFDEIVNPRLRQLGDGLVKGIYNSDWSDVSAVTSTQ